MTTNWTGCGGQNRWRFEDRMVFMHIPKCAGQRLKKLVRRRIGARSMYVVRDGYEMRKGLKDGNTNWFVSGHFGYQFIETFNEPVTKVTFLRDPIERTLSHYYYWRATKNDAPGPKAAKQLNLVDFLSSDANPVREVLENMQTWAFVAGHQLKIREKHRRLSDDAVLEKAVKNLSTFHFVGFWETFTDSFNRLCGWYDWRTAWNLSLVNESKRRSLRETLSDEEMAALEEITVLDRQLYYIARYELGHGVGIAV